MSDGKQFYTAVQGRQKTRCLIVDVFLTALRSALKRNNKNLQCSTLTSLSVTNSESVKSELEPKSTMAYCLQLSKQTTLQREICSSISLQT